MSRTAEITLDWGGEERPFRLAIGQLQKLDEKLKLGPLAIAARCAISIEALRCIQQADYVGLSRLDLSQVAEKSHTREVLLQGLLGMNVALPVADRLIREWVDERPLAENLTAAMQVCFASIYGPEDDKAVGESEAAPAASPTSPTDGSGSDKTASMPSAAH